MNQKPAHPDNQKSMPLAENFLKEIGGSSITCMFNQVIADVAKVYDRAILVGAVAAAKYIRLPNGPRVTYDVDFLLDETDFNDFLNDDIPPETLSTLEALFEDPDSPNHSLKHRKTGIYVDFLSAQSKPVSKKFARHIIENRENTTNVITIGDQPVHVLKPEFIIAMKMNRCTKSPRSERGLSDRIDIIKLLKTHWHAESAVDHDSVKSMINRNEVKYYESIVYDVTCEMDTPDE